MKLSKRIRDLVRASLAVPPRLSGLGRAKSPAKLEAQLEHIRKSLIRSAAREERLQDDLALAETRLKEVEIKEDDYRKRMNALKKEKRDLSTDIDGLLDEMERLEDGLENQRHLREETETEVLQLREEIGRLKNKQQKPRLKKKQIETINKRFKVLYKRLLFTDRAIEM